MGKQGWEYLIIWEEVFRPGRVILEFNQKKESDQICYFISCISEKFFVVKFDNLLFYFFLIHLYISSRYLGYHSRTFGGNTLSIVLDGTLRNLDFYGVVIT